MPVDSKGEMVNYTTDQDIEYLLEAGEVDFCVEFTGYLVETLGRVKAGPKNDKDLFKAVITNGSKRVLLLIWDIDLMQALSKKFFSGLILHLDGCEGRVVQMKTQHKELKVIAYELLIQKGTRVDMKGFHVDATLPVKAIPTINFTDIAKASSEIRVKAYVKTVLAQSYNKDGALGFGSGSITDGVHKLPINVKFFKDEDANLYSKGLCVLVTGNVSRKGNLRLLCQSIAHLEILANEQKMPEEQVSGANRPLKRWDPNNKEAVSDKKSCTKHSKEIIGSSLEEKDENSSNNPKKMDVVTEFKETKF